MGYSLDFPALLVYDNHMPNMTRRAFGGVLAGLAAATASAKGFVQHKILKRPYYAEAWLEPYPRAMLLDCLLLAADTNAALRIKITALGEEESLLEVTVRPKPNERMMLLGIHGEPADRPMLLRIESAKPIKDLWVKACHMRPPFRVEDDMMIFHDKRFPPEKMHGFIGSHQPIHRKLFGPGKDIGYC